MSVAQTSVDNHSMNILSGRYATQQETILAAIKENNGINRRELAKLTGLEINAVTGRCNELIASGKIEEDDPRKCSITGRMTKPLIMAGTHIPFDTSSEEHKYNCLVRQVARMERHKIGQWLDGYEKKHKDDGKLREDVRAEFKMLKDYR